MSTPNKSSPSSIKTSPSTSKTFGTPKNKTASPKVSPSTKNSPQGPTVSVVLLRQIPDPNEKNTNPSNVITSFSAFSIPKSQADGLKWEDSAAFAVLGFPVKGTRWQGEEGKVRNPLATGLFVEPDPTNLDDFGKVQFRRITGQFVVARQDEEPVNIEDISPLLHYLAKISDELIPFTKEVFLDGQERQRQANELAGRLFTPAAYQAYKATHSSNI